MYVKRLRLKNFRCYEDLDVELSPNINIIYGKNAQGKTNLLEAVYYCATGRSHRTSFDKECIRYDQDEAMIKIWYEKYKEDQIEIHLRKNGRKSVAINGYPAKKINELFGCFHVVVFSPEDLSLIKSGPAKRRKFMDMEICQVDPVYLHDLQQYCKVLKQRNQLLKEISRAPGKKETIFAWDLQLVHYGVKVMRRRAEFVSRLQKHTSVIHNSITHGEESLKILYENAVSMDESVFQRQLEKDFVRDQRYGSTAAGPHHDDLALFIDGSDVRVYGSQGQQRTTALSMKLAELEMMKEEIGHSPVLLLDDVMSELDQDRQLHLARYIQENQTIITCTGIEDSIRRLPAGKMYQIQKGRIVQ